MWLKAFAWKKGKRYRALQRRYQAFHPDDTVEICDLHHEEIHVLYGTLIEKAIAARGFLAVSLWSWGEADDLMKHLTLHCNTWLTEVTPGKALEKFSR
jgi:hypothetical protein